MEFFNRGLKYINKSLIVRRRIKELKGIIRHTKNIIGNIYIHCFYKLNFIIETLEFLNNKNEIVDEFIKLFYHDYNELENNFINDSKYEIFSNNNSNNGLYFSINEITNMNILKKIYKLFKK